MIEHERVLAALQTQADTIARLERELAEARYTLKAVTDSADAFLRNIGERRKEIEALTPDAEALRALAAWGMDEAGRSVDFSQGAEVYVWLSWIAHIADEVGNNRDSVCGEGVTLAAAIMDALALANANRAA